jgi:hypothetical protein
MPDAPSNARWPPWGVSIRSRLQTECAAPIADRDLTRPPTRACSPPSASCWPTCPWRASDAGNTIVIIEHNLDVIKTADWLIDMGPEGGDGGGRIVAVGTPEDVAQSEASHTGRYLKRLLASQSL